MIAKSDLTTVTVVGDSSIATRITTISYPTFESESINVFVTLLAVGVETPLVVGVDYSELNLGVNGINGSVTLIDAAQLWISNPGVPATFGLLNTYSITVEFDPEAFQPGSFRSLGNYSPITMEQVFDRLTMAIKAGYREVVSFGAQIITNTNNIANNAAAIVANGALIAAQSIRLTVLEDVNLSKTLALTNGMSSTLLSPTQIDELEHNDLIMEYVAKRGALTQYGRVLLTNDNPFDYSILEQVGDAGVSFNSWDSGGTGLGYLRVSTDTSSIGTLRYTIKKFAL